MEHLLSVNRPCSGDSVEGAEPILAPHCLAGRAYSTMSSNKESTCFPTLWEEME